MKTLILCGYGDGNTETCALTLGNRFAYASRHGYDLKLVKGPYNSDGAIQFLREIEKQLDEYNMVFTMGADTIFTNMEKRIEELAEESDAVLLATEHISWFPFNNDVMLWCDCDCTRMLLTELQTTAPEWRGHPWMWQWGLYLLMQAKNAVFETVVRLVPARTMNSCWQDGAGKWEPGDFIFHALNLPEAKKRDLLRAQLLKLEAK